MDAKTLGMVFLSGLIILVGAIVVNIIAKSLQMRTWFDFLGNLSEKGITQAFSQLNIASVLYLFLIYPLALGFLVFLCVRWLF